MSIGSLGIVGSLAGTALPQRAAEAERAERETTDQDRAAEASQQAENAAGIGQTEEDSQASERDADGRRLWEQQQRPDKETPATRNRGISGRPCQRPHRRLRQPARPPRLKWLEIFDFSSQALSLCS